MLRSYIFTNMLRLGKGKSYSPSPEEDRTVRLITMTAWVALITAYLKGDRETYSIPDMIKHYAEKTILPEINYDRSIEQIYYDIVIKSPDVSRMRIASPYVLDYVYSENNQFLKGVLYDTNFYERATAFDVFLDGEFLFKDNLFWSGNKIFKCTWINPTIWRKWRTEKGIINSQHKIYYAAFLFHKFWFDRGVDEIYRILPAPEDGKWITMCTEGRGWEYVPWKYGSFGFEQKMTSLGDFRKYTFTKTEGNKISIEQAKQLFLGGGRHEVSVDGC